MLKSLFTNIEFNADQKLVQKYCGITLDRETFDRYSSQFTLSKVMGGSTQIEKKYHGLGIPRSVGDAEICADILYKLETANIVFKSTPDTQLGQKLSQHLSACRGNNLWLSLPNNYRAPV